MTAPTEESPAEATGLVAPAGGWQAAMTSQGTTYHVLDPIDDHVRTAIRPRRALCGIEPVFPVRPVGTDDVRKASPLCRRCQKTLTHYAEPPAESVGPDPLLHLLRAGGLTEASAQTAAGIARGYLAAELNSALARGQVAVNERAQRRSLAGRETAPLRFGALMLSWGRDVVHARRTWPPEIVGDPPGEPA